MGPKYEFTGETKKQYDYTLHRIRRLSDGKLGGWIESEENLSQEGGCWVDGEAKVYNEAKVYGNAQVYDNATITERSEVYEDAKVYGDAWISRAKIFGNAKVYGDAQVYNWSKVYGDAKVYGRARAYFCYICDNAQVYDNTQIYGHGSTEETQIYDNAKVYGNTQVYNKVKAHGDALVHDIKIFSGEYTSGEYFDKNYINEEPLANPITEVVQDFIYKVDDSNKLTTQTEYDSVDEFFNEPAKNDIKLDTLVICTIDTKEPLIKLQKVEADNRTEFKFIVDIINEDNDNFMFKSIIKSQEQLNQLIQKTIEALRLYPKFNKYADDLEEYL